MRKIPLTNSKEFALVDDNQYEKAMEKKWYKNSQGYAVSTSSHPHHFLFHVFLFGKAPKGFVWDHRNRNRLDNRNRNLRYATRPQNGYNSKKRVNNTTGYIGVYRSKNRKRWWASAGHGRIGIFDSAIEAAKARDFVAFYQRGKFAVLNFPIQRFPRLKEVRK